MRQLFTFFILLIVSIFRGINYVVAQVSIPLSKIPFLIGAFCVWILQSVIKMFITTNGDMFYIYTSDYEEMIQKIKQKRYDELYSEMKKREDQDKLS